MGCMTDSVDLLKKIVTLKPGGEVREQQHTAVSEIEAALHNDRNLLLEAPTGSGKALLTSTPILTAKGWSTMGELKEGDLIYGTNGKTTRVTKAHTPFMSKEMYRVEFSNGEVIFADSDHLWNVEPLGKHRSPVQPKPLDTARVAELGEKTLALSVAGSTHALKGVEALNIYPNEVILHAFSHSSIVSENETVAEAEANDFIENLYQEILGRASTWRTGDMAAAYNSENSDDDDPVIFTVKRNQPIGFGDTYDRFPVPTRLYGEWLAGSNNAFSEEHIQALTDKGIIAANMIPDEYFYAPVPHRNQLLLGIFGGQESGEFHTTSSVLADDIQFLIATLGRVSERVKYFEGDQLVEGVTLYPPTEDSLVVSSIQRVPSEIVRCITVDAEDHLFLAGKNLIPTHNTLSYLIPLVENETVAVVSTATKQLSEQIMKDIDFLNDSLKALKSEKRADATLLKGRENYLCLAKFDEVMRLETRAGEMLFTVGDGETNALSDQANKLVAETKAVSDWANETKTGDRTEAPAASDETWRQYSSTNAECPGRAACPFGQECFAERARDRAKEAKIVITNHAIVALDLDSEGQLLGDRDVFVFDELHELDTYMSSAWGAELTYRRLDATHKLLKTIPSLNEKLVEELGDLLDLYDKSLRTVEKGLIDNEDSSVKLENFLIRLANVMTKLTANVMQKEKDSGTDALKRVYTKAKKASMELQAIAETLSKTDFETVRWTVDSADRKKFEKGAKRGKAGAATSALKEPGSTMSMHAAPLRIGPKLQRKLSEREAIMVGLSATVTVMGRTDIPVHNLGLDEKPHKVVVLDTPFDYKKQAMLYIPDPKSFPVPLGQDKRAHAEAMKADSAKLIEAAGGRALILSTTSDGVKDYAEYYRKKLPKLEFLAQGDAPNSQLVDQFKRDEKSCLIGTMGFWHGLDAPGKTLTLDIIDKIPFPTPDDPLLAARKNYADKLGRNGFMEIYVTIADWMLRQGFGRAIRSKSDRAVIAIYDTRLINKAYGRAIMQNFHGVGLFHNHEKVVAALKRLVASY